MNDHKQFNPWEGMYNAMYEQVPQNEKEKIATRLLREGTGCLGSQTQSGLTPEEFADLYDRLRKWENINCSNTKNWNNV